MPRACDYQAVPIDDELHKLEWIGVSALPSIVFDAIEGPVGWVLSGVASQLISVDNLCASNPEVPEAFTDDDLISKLDELGNAGPFPYVHFNQLLWEWIRYGAFLNFCQCVQAPPVVVVPPTTGFPLCTTSTQSTHETAVMSNPRNLTGIIQVADALDVPGVIHTVQTWSNAVPGAGGHLSAWIRWFNASLGDVTPYPAFPSTYLLDGSDPCLLISFSVPTGATQFVIEMSQTVTLASGCIDSFSVLVGHGAACPVPPSSGPGPSITAPTAPTNDCTAGTLCNITWLIQNQLTNNASLTSNNNTQITNITAGVTTIAMGPTVYVLGDSHSVSGSGSIAVSDGTLGVLVDPDSPVAGAGFIETAPPYLFDQGETTFQNAEGFGQRTRVTHDPQLVMTDVQLPTAVFYDCQMSGGMTITELVSPPPAPPPPPGP